MIVIRVQGQYRRRKYLAAISVLCKVASSLVAAIPDIPIKNATEY
jgi:hypothetical protein